ncbi:MAG: hypothetical protein R3Y13_04740 [bacterium]
MENNNKKSLRIAGILGVCFVILGTILNFTTVRILFNYATKLPTNLRLINHVEGWLILIISVFLMTYFCRNCFDKVTFIKKIHNNKTIKDLIDEEKPKTLLMPVFIMLVLMLSCTNRISLAMGMKSHGMGYLFFWSGIFIIITDILIWSTKKDLPSMLLFDINIFTELDLKSNDVNVQENKNPSEVENLVVNNESISNEKKVKKVLERIIRRIPNQVLILIAVFNFFLYTPILSDISRYGIYGYIDRALEFFNTCCHFIPYFLIERGLITLPSEELANTLYWTLHGVGAIVCIFNVLAIIIMYFVNTIIMIICIRQLILNFRSILISFKQ